MHIFAAGVDQSAPLEIRERMTCTNDKLARLKLELASRGIRGYVLISTCNRWELYADCAAGDICDFLAAFHGVEPGYLYCLTGAAAVSHLYACAAGLKSMVIGEDQILGQIGAAHRTAMKGGHSSGVLNRVFFNAVRSGREVRRETGISRRSLSVSSVGVAFLRARIDNLSDKKILIIGTGKMGRLAALKLISLGAHDITVTSRTRHNADKFAVSLPENVKTTDYDQRGEQVRQADVIISCTSSPHSTITPGMLPKDKAQYILDLALPRDVHPDCANLPGVELYTMDSLKETAQRNLECRLAEAEHAQEIITRHVVETMEWLARYPLLETTRLLHRHGSRLAARQRAYARRKLHMDDAAAAKLDKIIDYSVYSALKPILCKLDDPDLNAKIRDILS